jgi:hypothetical protein
MAEAEYSENLTMCVPIYPAYTKEDDGKSCYEGAIEFFFG